VSEYAVLAAVDGALRQMLWQEFQADSVINPIVQSESAIVFTNPSIAAQDSSNRLSIWLYRLTENEFVKNQPLERTNGDFRFPPLALDLSYLVTPLGATGDADHLLLGKAMQVLYDNAITLLSDPVSSVFEELRIVLARLALDEITGIWQALREPYRLSVGYCIRVTRIESLRTIPVARVVDRAAAYSSFAGVPA
jgi:hypothetical protein